MKWLLFTLVACGSNPSPPAKPAAPPPVAAAPSVDAAPAQDDRAAIVEAHRKIEEQQQEALAETCDDPAPKNDHARCLPSCYATEGPDARANKKLIGALEIEHTACQRSDGTLVLADELDAKLRARPFAKRFPPLHKKASWQAAIETALSDKLPRGDVIVVTGAWHDVAHPLTHERLRCVTVAHYTHAHHALDACGGNGEITCEAAGNAAARAINVVHYRLAEARRLQTAGKRDDCQQAALEAIAVARGLPRWRQYAKLNVAQWKDNLSYRTRFDGVLDEDTLFATVATLGSDAETIYAACGGPNGAPTGPEQEQSFHTCW